MGQTTNANEGGGETGRTVVVRYWAAARAASGVEADVLEIGSWATLSQVLESVRSRHLDRPRLTEVISVCSVLVGDRPVGTTDPDQVLVRPGDTIELLPPFAGG